MSVRIATAYDAPTVAALLDAFNREFDTPTPGVTVLTDLNAGIVMAHFLMSMLTLVVAGTLAWRVSREQRGRAEVPRHDALTVWAMRGLVAKRTAGKVFPQIEVFELEAGAGFVVAGEQREIHVVSSGERVEQFADAGHQPLSVDACVLELDREMTEVRIAESQEVG